MENIHFVEHAEYCPKAIILSTVCANDVSFRFLKENIVTSDIEKSFHDIRLNPEEHVYIQLNFLHSNKNPHYGLVIEENPYLPESLQPDKQFAIWTDFILDEALVQFKQKKLNEQIDEALNNGDKARFLELTEELNKLLNNY